MTFLYNGAVEYSEPGVFMAFEERPEDIMQNVGSLSYDIEKLIAEKKLAIDHVEIERSEIAEAGEYDLEGLFIRLGFAIDSIGAKRVVIDTIETLFAGLENEQVLRAELRRLFGWLKDKGVTAIITGERGEGTLTRYGLEEYVADCVILLDNRVQDQLSTRRLRIVKYRGSAHGTNEYPFIIDEEGISVMPITSSGLAHEASTERMSSGIADLDAMLEGKGYSEVRASWCPAWPAAARRRSPRISSTRPAPRATAVSISRWRNRRPDRPQHALDRHRPARMGRQEAAAVQRAAAEPVRSRDASRDHASRRDRIRSGRRRHRSDVGLARRGRDRRRAFDGASPGRFP